MRQTLNMTPAGTTQYVYDIWDHVIAETNGSGTVVKQYVWIGDLPVAVLDGSSTPSTPTLLFVHADHLKRPELMTDATGAVVWKAVYEPFGAVSTITGTASNNYRFPGQWYQLETGLHYNWHRHYDPTLGRYTSPDPIGVSKAGPSVFGYARQSPLMLTDRDGRNVVSAGLAICEVDPALCPIIAAGAGAYGVYVGLHWLFTPPAPNICPVPNDYGKPANGDPANPPLPPLITPAITTDPDPNPGGLSPPDPGVAPPLMAVPPDNAYDPNGPKAPGYPGGVPGYEDPKNGPDWVPNPNGQGFGWKSKDGRVWVPTGQGGGAHGGPHWDVQSPDGDYENVKPPKVVR